MQNYQRVNPIHNPMRNHHFPMVFLWFTRGYWGLLSNPAFRSSIPCSIRAACAQGAPGSAAASAAGSAAVVQPLTRSGGSWMGNKWMWIDVIDS